MHSGVAMSHNDMINHSSPHFDEYRATMDIHASDKSAGAVESGSSGGSRDNVQNLEENAVDYASRAKILLTIAVPHRIKCTGIDSLKIRRWWSLKPFPKAAKLVITSKGYES